MMDHKGAGDQAHKQGNHCVVEFGVEDVQVPVSGRRAKALKERRQKLKPGSFGEIFIIESVASMSTYAPGLPY